MIAPVTSFSAEYARFRLRLLTGLLIVACLSIVAVCWKIHASFVERERAARLQNQTYAHAIAAHVADSIELADYALTGFANAIKAMPPQQSGSVPFLRKYLSGNMAASSEAFWMIFIDANGTCVAASKHLEVQGTSYADRDYFRVHADSGADRGMFIAEPISGRVTQRRIFIMSRRVLNARGQFIGVIAVPMEAARFGSMLERARMNADIAIMLVHQGGKIIAAAPKFEHSSGTSLSVPLPFRSRYERFFQANSPVDGRLMLYSGHALEGLPISVIAGISMQSLNQAWHTDLLIGGSGIALMAIIMWLLAHVALTAFRRLASSKQALQESEFRWKFALEGAGDGMFDWDTASNAVLATLLCKNMLGYADMEIDNTFAAWAGCLHPDDQPHVASRLARCLAGDTPVYVSEHRMRCKDGRWKWILARAMVIRRNGAGRAERMIGSLSDIDHRKQAEQAQVRRIVEAAPDPMLLIGTDDSITFANAAAQSAFGFTLQELKDLSIHHLLPFLRLGQAAPWRSAIGSEAASCGLKAHAPLSGVRRDGSAFPVEISLSQFRMDDNAVVIASLRDVSKRLQAAQLLEQSHARLRLLSDHQQNIKEDERKRIARDMHDDLGQNLLVLKMDVALLAGRTAGSHSRLHQRTTLVLANIDATIRAVKSIMNDLRPATLELGLYPAVEWQLMQFERMSGIACTLAPEIAFELDEGRTLAVFRVLQEALTNIARHAEASAVEIVLSQDAGGFAMTVQDNGKGLHPDDRKKANCFGLMGIRERIHSLGGQLRMVGSPGNGTLLSIVLAAKPPLA
ncbi:MAG: PAS domain S-box protein [Massilia sp.]|nr:PAS domain S-box protein [Massilia sp.]